jgi:hypothetical protein
MKRIVLPLLVGAAGLVGPGHAQAPKAPPARAATPTPEQARFFEKHVRPVLVTTCFKCHNSEAGKVRGGLALDTPDGLRKGGDNGPVLVPGQPGKSRLLKALRHQGDLKMPPKNKLPDSVVADFERWISMGAPDPRVAAVKVAKGGIDVEKGRKFWSFQPVKKAAPPAVKDRAWPRTDVDRFLLAALEKKGLRPVADADRHTLLRRVYLDLTGLPPTPAEIDAFLADRSPGAFAKVVDRLLASPHFGERWGRHWLDVARYAESSGKQVNFNYPYAWRYRDYVIAAFNKDKPFNRFVLEQLAGDRLPYENAAQRAEQQIATGFLAVGPKLHVEANREQFLLDVVDEQIDATTQAFLGLTVACARCHDHKFDPIPMADYYAMAGIFRSTRSLYGTIRIIQNNHPSSLISLPKGSGVPAGVAKMTQAERRRLKDSIKKGRERQAELFRKKDGKSININRVIFNSIITATQEGRLAAYEEDGTPKLLAMGVRDRPFPEDIPLYARGELSKPGPTVRRGFVQVLTAKGGTPPITAGSGRKDLAAWIASPDNPLTARVMVNRVWLHLFGRGLVPTPDNFGNAGLPPSHPELLDHLAASFVAEGWSVKKLIRSIVLSRAYQLSARHDARNYEIDPDNELVWRMSKRRVDAEVLRDSILAVSGQLETAPPEGSPVALAGDGYTRGGFGGRFGGGPPDARSKHRSVYLPVVRDQPLESLSLFDFADPNMVIAQRATTSVPAQGLYLLNNPFVMRQADAAADRLLKEGADDNERIRIAYLRFLGRPPSEREARATRDFLGDGAREGTRRAAWSAFCQSLIASADFLYRS